MNDGDLFWHLATARWVVEHGQLMRTDAFSSTAAGAPVPQHEWLTQMILYAAFSAWSWAGIVVVRIVAVLLLATLLLAAALRVAPRPSIAVIAAMPAIALSRVDWNDRAELYALVCFAALVAAGVAARDGRTRALLALPPLFLLWANLHGSFALGIAVLGILAAEAVVFAPALGRAFVGAGLASVAATVVTPEGIFVYADPLWHLTRPPRFIEEWRALDPSSAEGALFIALLVVVAAVALRVRAGTRWIALLAPLAVLGVVAIRYEPYFAVAAGPFLAASLGAVIAPRGAAGAPPIVPGRRLAMGLTVAGILTSVLAVATVPREPDLAIYPVRAVPLLSRSQGVILNEYLWGGYLIWSTRRPVFVDGRLRPYEGRVLDDYLDLVTLGPDRDAILARYDVRLVVMRADQPLVAALRRAGWRDLLDDPVAAVLQRP